MRRDFKTGDLIIYQNGDTFQIGKVKRVTDTGAFVWYTGGDTASRTPFSAMHKLENAYTIKQTSLGGIECGDKEPSTVCRYCGHSLDE